MASFHTIRNLRNNYGGEYNNDDQNNYKSDFQNRDFYENICKLKRYKTVKALKKLTARKSSSSKKIKKEIDAGKNVLKIKYPVHMERTKSNTLRWQMRRNGWIAAKKHNYLKKSVSANALPSAIKRNVSNQARNIWSQQQNHTKKRNNNFNNSNKYNDKKHLTRTMRNKNICITTSKRDRKTKDVLTKERIQILRKPKKFYEKRMKNSNSCNNNNNINNKNPPTSVAPRKKTKKLFTPKKIRTKIPSNFIGDRQAVENSFESEIVKKTSSRKERLEILTKPNKSHDKCTKKKNNNNNKYTNNYKIESPPHITKTVFFATPETNIEKKTLRNTIEERFERLRKPNKSYEKYVKKIIKVNNNDFIINNTKSPPRKIKKLVVFTTTPNAYITKKKTLSMKEQLEILRKPNKSYEEVMKGLNATLNSLENTRVIVQKAMDENDAENSKIRTDILKKQFKDFKESYARIQNRVVEGIANSIGELDQQYANRAKYEKQKNYQSHSTNSKTLKMRGDDDYDIDEKIILPPKLIPGQKLCIINILPVHEGPMREERQQLLKLISKDPAILRSFTRIGLKKMILFELGKKTKSKQKCKCFIDQGRPPCPCTFSDRGPFGKNFNCGNPAFVGIRLVNVAGDLRPVFSALTTLIHECAHSEPMLRKVPGKPLGKHGHGSKWKALYQELLETFLEEVVELNENGGDEKTIAIENVIGLDVAASVQECAMYDMMSYRDACNHGC